MHVKKFEGIYTPSITPLNADEQVDEKAFVKHLDRLIDNGIHGIYLLGTSGEFVALTEDQRKLVMQIAVDRAGGRVPIICGTMDSSTKRVIRNVELAQEFGVDAVAMTPPYYYPPDTDADIIAFYKSVAASTDLPVVIYNIPQTTKVMVKAEVVCELNATVENIVGVKDSSRDWDNFLKMLADMGEDEEFSILLGAHTLAGAAIMLGAEGAVMSISNIDPRTAVKTYEAAKAKMIDELNRLQFRLLKLGKLYTYGSPVSCIKACMEIMGICRAYTTSPLQPIDEEERPELEALLEEYGL